MAVEPLFNKDLETLLKRARIETADDEQTMELIYQAVSEVRIGIYRAVTSARATTIAGYSLVDNPTSDEEILRASGANTEANWLTWILAQRLPFLFMDNRSSVQDAFNDEQLTRDSAGIQEFLDELKAQIDLGLGDLMEPPSEDSGPTKASSISNSGDAFTPMAAGSFRGLYPCGTNTGTGGNF
jgi:hypothetical protein